jgi:hypothetical protein
MVTGKTGKYLQNSIICTEIRRMGEWENERMPNTSAAIAI